MTTNLKISDTQVVKDIKSRLETLETYGIFTSLIDLKNATAGQFPFTLITSNGKTEYAYMTGNFSGQADDVNVVKLNQTALTVGALVKQDASSVSLKRSGTSIYRSLTDKLAEAVSVLDFGAIPNWDPSAKTGFDSSTAFQAAIDYAIAQGGIDVFVPPIGAYMISKPLVIKNKVTLRGCSDIQGSAGAIHVTGSAFLSTPEAFPFFNLKGICAVAGTRQVTDFITRSNGVWAYSTVENCYFVNFRNFDQICLGLHFINNNFQNFGKIHIGGADMVWAYNYANLDETNTSTTEVFFQMEAVSATDFSHNYLTCFRSADNDPIVLDWNLCDHCRCNFNQLDGGTSYTLRLSSASKMIEVFNNRLASLANYTDHGRIPILLNQDITDVNIKHNWFANLKNSDPVIAFGGRMNRVVIEDNIANDGKDDYTLHDFKTSSGSSGVAEGSRITMNGASVPKTASLVNGGRFFSPHFTRILTNDPTVGTDNPRINYLDMAAIDAGVTIDCVRVDTSRRWIIYDQTNNKAIYDSDTTSKQSFKLFSPTNGQMIVLA